MALRDTFERLSAQAGTLQSKAGKLPKSVWVAGGVLAASAAAVGYLNMSGPPYVVLDEGLTPANGGKVIAQLQKLGIPYQLQAAGDVIEVPEPMLAQARLQLGADQVPGTDASNAWNQLENAPMTTSDLAQTTMADQALELTLQQAIEQLQGVKSAQVFLAIPPETPFLADQPQPSASVVITANAGTAQTQGAAIANMVAGAVPGLDMKHVSVETTAGLSVYPQNGSANTAAQLATQSDVEDAAVARVSDLLTTLVGAGNFQTDITADIDFTRETTHEVQYGPGHIVQHEADTSSNQTGSQSQVLGIPGALSNEPPAATTANPAPVPAQGATNGTQNSQNNQQSAQTSNSPPLPQQSSKKQDETYVTDESDSDIIKPNWTVKGLAVSVVVNDAVLGKTLTQDQIKTAVAGIFSYPNVTVNVLAAPLKHTIIPTQSMFIAASIPQLSRSVLEILAGFFVLFGLALPLRKKLSSIDLDALVMPPLPPVPPPPLPKISERNRDMAPLREAVIENAPGAARLLQGYIEEGDA